MKYTGKRYLTPPGTLLSQEIIKPLQVKTFRYDRKEIEILKDLSFKDLAEQREKKDLVLWIDIQGLNDGESLKKIGDIYSLSSLLLEDIQNTKHRPKIEIGEDYLFLSLPFCLEESPWTKTMTLVLKENLIISFSDEMPSVFSVIEERLKLEKGLIRQKDTSYLFFSLIDVILDQFFIKTEELDKEIEKMEEMILVEKEEVDLKVVYHLKKILSLYRWQIEPLALCVGKMKKGLPLISEEHNEFFSDLYDHSLKLKDLLAFNLENLNSLISLHMTSVSNKMNDVMKVLTLIATIFIPLTFIAGVYGMNFQQMPELTIAWAYPAVLGLMAGVAILMVVYFKKKKWM